MNKLKSMAAALALALGACSGGTAASDYNPDLCDNLIETKNSVTNLSQITDSEWSQMLSQFKALNLALADEIQTLLDTPWSAEKEKAINTLVNSRMVRQWHELAYMASAARHPGIVNPAIVPEGYVEAIDSLMLQNTRYLMYLTDTDQL